jgi:hypothetical protein
MTHRMDIVVVAKLINLDTSCTIILNLGSKWTIFFLKTSKNYKYVYASPFNYGNHNKSCLMINMKVKNFELINLFIFIFIFIFKISQCATIVPNNFHLSMHIFKNQSFFNIDITQMVSNWVDPHIFNKKLQKNSFKYFLMKILFCTNIW